MISLLQLKCAVQRYKIMLSCMALFCQALHQILLNPLMHSSVLPHAMQILFNHNSQQGILDLLDGIVDVAIARADILSDMQTSGLIQSMDLFKCITAVCFFSALTPLPVRLFVCMQAVHQSTCISRVLVGPAAEKHTGMACSAHTSQRHFVTSMGGCLNAANACAQPSPHFVEKKDNEKTTPFGVNLMRSQVLYQAARSTACTVSTLCS